MPTEKADLRRLSRKITASAAPLHNVEFVDQGAAAVICLSAVRRSVDVGTYRAAKQTSVKEFANRDGALLAQGSFI